MSSRKNRKGAAAAEAALMLPLLIIVTFGSIDMAQFINSGQVIANASREGARIASRNETGSISEIETGILNYLANSISQLSRKELESAVTIDVRDSSDGTSKAIQGDLLSSVDSGGTISISIEFDFSAIRWIYGPDYGTNKIMTYCRRD